MQISTNYRYERATGYVTKAQDSLSTAQAQLATGHRQDLQQGRGGGRQAGQALADQRIDGRGHRQGRIAVSRSRGLT